MTADFFLKKLIQQDPSSWNRAFGELYPIAFRAAKLRLPDLSDADLREVASETLHEIQVKVATVDTYDGLKALTVTIARCRCISHLRKQTAKIRGSGKTRTFSEMGGAEESWELQMPDAGSTPAQDTENAEFLQVIHDFIQLLEGNISKVVECIFVQDLSYQETSEKLDMPINTVGVYVSRGVDRLRRQLAKNPSLMKYFEDRAR